MEFESISNLIIKTYRYETIHLVLRNRNLYYHLMQQ